MDQIKITILCMLNALTVGIVVTALLFLRLITLAHTQLFTVGSWEIAVISFSS